MDIKKVTLLSAVLTIIILFSGFYSSLRAEDTVPVIFNPEDLVLWVFGDIQPRNEKDRCFFKIAADDVAEMKNIDASLCAGDIVQFGNEQRALDSYKWFYEVYKKTGIKNIYEIAGNHDARNIPLYYKATGKPLHYSLQYGNLLIILLSDEIDSSGSDISDGAFNWWKTLIETNRDKNIITMTHSHLGGSGFIYNIISYRNVQRSERFTDVLKKEKVELWLCGHTHIPSFFGMSKRQISSLNKTVFMNVASIREDFFFSDAESRFIILKKGSDVMTVQIRNHRQGEFENILEQNIKLRTGFEYNGKGPVMTIYKEN